MGRLSQPQQAVRIDLSNPITRGLIGPFNPAAGLHSNNLILSSGTGVIDGIASNGRALVTDANQESRYTTWRRSDGAMTVAWLGDLIASPTADACLGGITHNDTNAGPYVAIEIKRRQGSSDNLYLNWSFGSGAGNVRTLLTAGTSYTSSKNLLLIGSVSSGLQSLSVYQNKALVERVTAANADTINYGAGPRVEMGDSLNARNPNALHNLMLLWNRQLSTSEERTLAANPWQIFEKTRRDFFFSPVSTTPVTSDMDVRWNILSPVTSDIDARWNALSAVISNADLRWNTLSEVSSDITFQWDVQSSLTAVTSDIGLQWDIRSAVVSDCNLQWSMLQAVQSDIQARWNILNQVLGDISIRWNVISVVQSDITLQWTVLSGDSTPTVGITPITGYVTINPTTGYVGITKIQ